MDQIIPEGTLILYKYFKPYFKKKSIMRVLCKHFLSKYLQFGKWRKNLIILPKDQNFPRENFISMWTF